MGKQGWQAGWPAGGQGGPRHSSSPRMVEHCARPMGSRTQLSMAAGVGGERLGCCDAWARACCSTQRRAGQPVLTTSPPACSHHKGPPTCHRVDDAQVLAVVLPVELGAVPPRQPAPEGLQGEGGRGYEAGLCATWTGSSGSSRSSGGSGARSSGGSSSECACRCHQRALPARPGSPHPPRR